MKILLEANMSNATFIAVEDPVDIEGNSIPTGIYNTGLFKLISCDQTECRVVTGSVDVMVTKKNHPRTYRNFSEFSKSSNVFRASNDTKN